MINIKKMALMVGMGLMILPQTVMGATLGRVNVEALNVRESASADSMIKKKLVEKEIVQITGIETDEDEVWYKLNIEGEEGYVKGDYLTVTKADGVITASSLKVRSYPDLQNSQVISSLPKDTQVVILYKVNGFYKIMVEGKTGFVYADYVACEYDAYLNEVPLEQVGKITEWKVTSLAALPSEPAKVEETQTSKGEQVVSTAMKYLGNPYVYGGTSLTKGTDCSGFTQGVMKLNGVTIPRTSSQQGKVGTLISKANLKKGDLLFFGKSTSAISHCGIYIGEGKMIHASTSSTGIIIANKINSSGNLPLQVIRRVV